MKATEQKVEIEHLLISLSSIKIISNKNDICANVRTKFDAVKAASLREDIRTKGLINDPIVRKMGTEYHLLCGERRIRSISKLVDDKADCFCSKSGKYVSAKELYSKIEVKAYTCDDITAIGIAISDNVEREDLTEIEKIEACIKYDNALDTEGNNLFTRDKIAELFGVSESWISQTISIGKLPKCALVALSEGIINRTAALQLLKTKPDKVASVISYARNFIEKDFCNKIQETIDEVEAVSQDIQLATVDLELAELQKKRTPDNKKGDADKLVQKANIVLSSKEIELANARKRLAALNSTGNPRVINADIITKANENLGVQTGKARPLSIKQIREFKKELEVKFKGIKNKKAKRDIAAMICGTKLILREIEEPDVMNVIESIDDLVG